jgi:hypothetical protein
MRRKVLMSAFGPERDGEVAGPQYLDVAYWFCPPAAVHAQGAVARDRPRCRA